MDKPGDGGRMTGQIDWKFKRNKAAVTDGIEKINTK